MKIKGGGTILCSLQESSNKAECKETNDKRKKEMV
jgi:hypothetical protein